MSGASTAQREAIARRSSDLTAEEHANVRTALRFLRTRCGGWEGVSKVLHFSANSIKKILAGSKSISPTLTFRLARAAKVPIDDVLAGKYPPANACRYCGHVKDESEEIGTA